MLDSSLTIITSLGIIAYNLCGWRVETSLDGLHVHSTSSLKIKKLHCWRFILFVFSLKIFYKFIYYFSGVPIRRVLVAGSGGFPKSGNARDWGPCYMATKLKLKLNTFSNTVCIWAIPESDLSPLIFGSSYLLSFFSVSVSQTKSMAATLCLVKLPIFPQKPNPSLSKPKILTPKTKPILLVPKSSSSSNPQKLITEAFRHLESASLPLTALALPLFLDPKVILVHC